MSLLKNKWEETIKKNNLALLTLERLKIYSKKTKVQEKMKEETFLELINKISK